MNIRNIGETVIDVKDHGAKGDGIHDDTAAFEAAYAALANESPDDGGTVFAGMGEFLIDPTKSIRPRNNTRLTLVGSLLCKPTNLPRAYVISLKGVHDVEIIGGQIVGDLDTFVPSSTSTQEWRHGIAAYDCQAVTIKDMDISKCCGDALSIGGTGDCHDIVVDGITATACRRQGVSVTHGASISILNSAIADIGLIFGTSPKCGIDVEPEPGQVVRGLSLLNCSFTNCAAYGVSVLQRTDGGIIDGVTIDFCTIEKNHSNGMVVNGAKNVTTTRSRIVSNSATGVVLTNAVNYAHHDNTSGYNYARSPLLKPRAPFDLTGLQSPKTDRDMLLRGTVKPGETTANPGLVVGPNHYL